MDRKKLVYGLIGVIGSGKDFFAKELYNNHTNEGIQTTILDFSDGVRDLTFSILGLPNPPSIEAYNRWKDQSSVIVGFDETVTVNNRKFMTNIGGRLRKYDPLFWADWCYKNALKVKDDYDVFIFNSCRYSEESKKIFEFAEQINADVKMFFTDYKSERYCLSTDDSERYAIKFLHTGAHHREDITELVKRDLENYYG